MTAQRTLFQLSTAVTLCGILLAPARADSGCEVEVGAFVSINGAVEVQRQGAGPWVKADLATRLCEADTVHVGERSRAALSLANGAVLRVDQDTTIRLLDINAEPEERSLLELVKGAFQSFSRKPRFFSINTPYLNGSIEGTEFLVSSGAETSEITVYEGVVMAANEQGQVAVSPGESVRAAAGQAPVSQTVVKPRDQVQWGLHFPPVLSTADTGAAVSELQPAARCLAAGDTVCAFDALDAVPQPRRNAEFFTLRAAAQLAVGRVDEASADIAQALAADAQSSPAHALQSVIAVVANDNAGALASATQAVTLQEGTSAGSIALSYALQADLRLEEARTVLQQAVEQRPDDALAWARLAELRLMLGDRRRALAAADRAVAIEPGLSRTQTVFGFAALAAAKIAKAQLAFEQAITADSADPLPRLGLGLAKIRQGRLADGRRDLEAAVALDATSALLRAYLGKAYFEERRAPLDGQQFGIAEELDPLDPTAYLYDAIRMQSENAPVKAFRALEGAIARNDNRAIYRSRLLLDSDRAARGTSLARVYKDLGFDQLGINTATESIAFDPGNASAHRFLSDAYRDGVERVEISRVSELLQSQLLQDVNINPIQPSLSSTNLNIATTGGPAEPGFNEFTSLFERNQLKVDASGFGGSNDSLGGETVVSGIYGPASASAGWFSFDTDGFRANNDLDHEIWNAFGQWAVAPELNVQAEYLRRETSHGDLRQNFDLESFDDTYRRDLESDVWRFGSRYSPAAHSDFLFSYIHSDVDSSGQTVPVDIPGVITVREDQAQGDVADQFEGQYIFRAERYNLVMGATHAEADIDGQFTATATITVPPPFPGLPPFEFQDVQVFPVSSDTTDTRGYVYANATLLPSLVATVGVSYQDYDQELTSDGIVNDFDRWHPKVGLRWALTPTLTARAAYVETAKPILVSNRTLEPTQVAGFNQFFDDPDGTRADRYAGGLDWRPLAGVRVGGEMSKRDVESPVIDFAALQTTYEDRDEWLHRAYVFWNPHERWALSAEGEYDKFENSAGTLVASLVPDKVVTWSVPVKATYFDPLGWFAGLAVTYVDQEVRRDAAQSVLAQGNSDFALVDLSVGYRLPARRGAISLVLQNVGDENFAFQDNNYRTFGDQPYVGPYIPERVLMARLTLSY